MARKKAFEKAKCLLFVARNWPNIQDNPHLISKVKGNATTVAVTSQQSWKTDDARMRNFTIIRDTAGVRL